MLHWTDPQVGEAIIDVVLSLNYQSEMLYDQKVATASFSNVKQSLKSFDQIGSTLDEIDKALSGLSGHPGHYLRAMTKAFRTFARSLQGDTIAYPELLQDIQQLPSALIPDAKADHLRTLVEKQLTDLGYDGTLEDKAMRWLAETRIAPENVTTVAKNFMHRSKQDTLSRVTQLPPEDGIDSVNAARGVFWSGRSEYLGNFKGKLTSILTGRGQNLFWHK